MKARRNGAEVWAEVLATTSNAGRIYFLHVVERTAMAAGHHRRRDGGGDRQRRLHRARYSLRHRPADILPESRPIVDEIVALLKKRPALRVGVEGHTDNTGAPAANKTLSEARARSVRRGWSRARASMRANSFSAGFGQESPIADNRTEEGRAKNRRVEIVKKQ